MAIDQKQEERLENRIINERLSGACAFTAKLQRTNNSTDSPDIICVQHKRYSPKTRLVESDYEGHIEGEKLDNLKRIAKESPDHVKMEVMYRTSPRSKPTGRTVKDSGWSDEKIETKLDEFKEKQFDLEEWRNN